MRRPFPWFLDRRFAFVVGASFVLASLVSIACGPSTPPAPSWPQGTILALDGAPISAAEVDDIGDIVARIEPQNSPEYMRRIALTNVVFPRAVGIRLAGPARREAALALARSTKTALEAGQTPAGVETKSIEGGFEKIGLEAWRYAIDAELGKLSDPIETIGGFELVKVLARGQGGSPRDVRIKLELLFFPYVDSDDPRGTIQRALDHSKLVFVDESWRDIVPVSWQYRLRGGTP